MIHAFADDSRHEVVVVAAAAILREERVEEAEQILGGLKEAAGLPRSERLHCKVMFMGDARRGTAWESFKAETIYQLVRDVCEQKSNIRARAGQRGGSAAGARDPVDAERPNGPA